MAIKKRGSAGERFTCLCSAAIHSTAYLAVWWAMIKRWCGEFTRGHLDVSMCVQDTGWTGGLNTRTVTHGELMTLFYLALIALCRHAVGSPGKYSLSSRSRYTSRQTTQLRLNYWGLLYSAWMHLLGVWTHMFINYPKGTSLSTASIRLGFLHCQRHVYYLSVWKIVCW